MVAAIEQFDAGERLAAQASADGSRLIADALGTAAELARGFGATVLAVDPYDRETDAMWRETLWLPSVTHPDRECGR